jgi:hypothetical protein
LLLCILQVLCDRGVVLHALLALLSFASMFCSLTELPVYLAAPPYNLSPAMTGGRCQHNSMDLLLHQILKTKKQMGAC